MSSGLYTKPVDRPHHTPGVGHGVGNRLCSRCHNPRPNKGGGLFDGRWYGYCCKPAVVQARELARVTK